MICFVSCAATIRLSIAAIPPLTPISISMTSAFERLK